MPTTSRLPGYAGLILAAIGQAACAGTQAPPAAGPPMQSYEAEAVRATALERPLHIVFAWTLEEQSARFSGSGSTRVEPPLRARLDLFGPRGEAYLTAVLVDLQLRLPPGAGDPPLPPPALLWAAFGVFRPPDGATLTGSRREGTATTLEYTRGQERWTFRLEGGDLRSAEWVGPSAGRRSVTIGAAGAHGVPAEVSYRDWLAYRELRLTLEEVHETEGFPPDIWSLGR